MSDASDHEVTMCTTKAREQHIFPNESLQKKMTPWLSDQQTRVLKYLFYMAETYWGCFHGGFVTNILWPLACIEESWTFLLNENLNFILPLVKCICEYLFYPTPNSIEFYEIDIFFKNSGYFKQFLWYLSNATEPAVFEMREQHRTHRYKYVQRVYCVAAQFHIRFHQGDMLKLTSNEEKTLCCNVYNPRLHSFRSIQFTHKRKFLELHSFSGPSSFIFREKKQTQPPSKVSKNDVTRNERLAMLKSSSSQTPSQNDFNIKEALTGLTGPVLWTSVVTFCFSFIHFVWKQ